MIPQKTRTRHVYNADTGTRSVVMTEMKADGRFKAYVLEGENDHLIAYGFGHTRLAAVADLEQSIAMSLEEAR